MSATLPEDLHRIDPSPGCAPLVDGNVARMPPNEPKITEKKALETALERRLNRRTKVKGEMSMPAAPALIPLYLRRFAVMFAAIGKKFNQSELKDLNDLIRPRVDAAWAVSPHGRLFVSWESEPSPGTGVDYLVWHEMGTTEEQYAWWVENRPEPLFGKNPDARLVRVAEELLNPPGDHAILDVGAGVGRNSLPMARRGHPVTALELTPEFARIIGEKAAGEGIPIEVTPADALADDLVVEARRYSLVFCSEVTSHFRGPHHLRILFERAHQWLKPGGIFLVNAFVTTPGYRPDEVARQLGQVFWSTFFTPEDLAAAAAGLSFTRVSDESVHLYEQENQPADGWPPTGWFEDWSRGFDCFGLREGYPPIEMRWLMFRKEGA